MSFEHFSLSEGFSLKGGNGTPDLCADDEGEDDEDDEPVQAREGEIHIVVVPPGEAAQVVTMRNELKEMQRIVGGYIEVFPIGIEGAVGVCNDEGRLMGLPWSRFVPATDAPIAGPFFIAGDGSTFRSLSPSQIEEALSLFGSPQLKLGPLDLFFRFVVSGELAAVDGGRVTARRAFDLLGVCRLRIFEHAQNPGHAVVIATEIPGNPGPSVTNAAATIATQACARLALDPARLLFVEHDNDAHQALRPGELRARQHDPAPPPLEPHRQGHRRGPHRPAPASSRAAPRTTTHERGAPRSCVLALAPGAGQR